MKTKKISNTALVFLVGSFVVILKFFIAGMEIGSFKTGTLTGTDFGIAIASLGAIYSLRRSKWVRPDEKIEKNIND